MHCPECNYPLWNIAARQCPECGAPFRPSDFEFVVNSVVFCCPHCDQAYYGTGGNGHLHPRAFTCCSCHRDIEMDEMVLRPAEGVKERQTKVDRVPWLERSELGWFKAWFGTIGQAMVGPHRMMRGAPVDQSVRAWAFAAVTWAIFLGLGVALPFLGIGIALLISGENDAPGVMFSGVATAVGGLIAVLVAILVWGASTHALLKLTGGVNAPLSRTYEALCYSSGTCVVCAIPCIGPYCGSWIGAVWWIVSAVIMVIVCQRVHGGRATFAVLTLPLLAGLTMVGGYFSWLFLFLPTMLGAPSAATVAEVTPFTDSLVAYAEANNGRTPPYALVLVTETDLPLDAFVAANSTTDLSDVPVGDETIESLMFVPANQRRRVIEDVAAAMPRDVIAHRVGDFIFTYHGVEPLGMEPGLWMVVHWPDPDADNGPPTALIVGLADGTVTSNPLANVPSFLEEQNELRAAMDLPPLPDLSTITHDAPARAP